MADPLNTSRFYFSAALQAKLNVAQTKSAWGGLVKGDLGTTRTAKITRYASAQAAADKTGGTVLRSATNTGALTLTGGDLSGLGVLSGVTVNQAVDFSSGFHVLSFETAGGVEMRGALGLSLTAQVKAGVAAGAEVVYVFTSEGNLDAAKGWLLGDISILAPKIMPSGIGPKVPDLTAMAPATVEIVSYIDAQNPVKTQTVTFDVREENLEFEHKGMAQSYGDVRIDRSSVTLKHGKHQFAVGRTTMYHDGGEPAYAVFLDIQSYDTPWANHVNYPGNQGYDRLRDETHPLPCKFIVRNAGGQILTDWRGHAAIEQQDGLPLNDPSMHQRFDLDKSKPLRPHICVGMRLVFETRMPKDNSYRPQVFNGIMDIHLRPSLSKGRYACNPSEPMDSAYDQADGYMHMYSMPQWPIPSSNGAWAVQASTDDPYLYVEDRAVKTMQWCGWDYEPGSRSGHDYYNGKGGPRFDRSCMPSILAWFGTKPDGVRLAGNVPLRTMAHAFRLAYHNMSVTFNRAGAGFNPFWSTQDAQLGNTQTRETYYFSNTPVVPADKIIDTVIAGNGSSYGTAQRGSDGRPVYNGRASDHLHSYDSSAMGALFFNDPVNAIFARHDYNMLWAVSIAARGPTDIGPILVRSHAWRMLHYTMAWMVGAKHRMMMPQAAIEARLQVELEQGVYSWYKRAVIDNEQSYDMKALRGFGQLGGLTERYTAAVISASGCLGMYMGHAMIMMEACGLYDVMKAKSPKCATMLQWLVQLMDKQCIEMMVATGGYLFSDGEYAEQGTYPFLMHHPTKKQGEAVLDDMPANWDEWVVKYPIPVGAAKQDWVTWNHGGIKGNQAAQSLIAQWIYAREWAFPDVAHPKIAQAISMLSEMENRLASRIGAISNLRERSANDWVHTIPSHAGFKKPVKLAN